MSNQIFARQCTATKEGMSAGYCVDEGEAYFINEDDLKNYLVNECGCESLEHAYEDDRYYYTEWEEKSDAQYMLVDGKLEEIVTREQRATLLNRLMSENTVSMWTDELIETIDTVITEDYPEGFDKSVKYNGWQELLDLILNDYDNETN